MRTSDSATIGIAVDIPDPWGAELTRRRAAVGDPVAAYVPAHVTLLGPTVIDPAGLPAIERHLGVVAARHPAFALHLRGPGTFRPVTDVVFAALVTGDAECARLHEAILAGGLIERQTTFPYHPHVTVAHNVSPAQLDAAYADLAGFEATFRVAAFTLFEHGADGRWKPFREYPLAGRG